MDFIHYKLEKTDQGYIAYLYVDPTIEEFSAELGETPTERTHNLRQVVQQFVKKRLKGVPIITAKVMIGTTLLTSIPMQFDSVSAHDASFNMSYIYFGNTTSQIQAVDRTNENLNVVSPSYFDLNQDGTLKLTPMLDRHFIQEMHNRGIKVVPFVSNHWDRELGRTALENREVLTDQIAKAIIDYELDGVNVDIENVTEVDRDNYTDFVKLLREKLPADKEISVAVAANPNHWDKGWHGSYDYKALSEHADYLMLMAYDESYQGGPAGPVASMGWVERSIKAVVEDNNVPPEKVVLGLPFFGRYWNHAENTGGYGASNHQVESLITKYNGTVTFDEASQSPKASFTIKEGDPTTTISGRTLKPGTYELWYENNQSIKAKIDLVHKYNLKGTGSWSLGQENAAVWEHYGVWLREHIDTIPVDGDGQEITDNTEAAPSIDYPFVDSGNHWARDEILYVQQKKWFEGIGDRKFAPNDTLSRAAAATVIVRALELQPLKPTTQPTFADVKNHWAKDAIEIAAQHGIFHGKGNGEFAPDETLTREQMATVLDNIFRDMYDPAKKSDPIPFQDISKDKWSYDAIVSMKQQGFFQGTSPTTFEPTTSVSRAQMATILTNAADRIAQQKGEVVFPRNLKLQNEGADVTLLQIYLKRLGYTTQPATGIFDKKTDSLIRSFQQDHNLTSDGIVGPHTSGKLLDVIR
ncbi:glycosyl hydrolase family 18 protein [Oceanobacillus halotolerans]|uniref:glycosyl hydrolase family 18 protein n=1 Tax=Oceanobacillus halotolerans TaxID=2663380 RepID=UPI001969D853|nr:glycosyl hydrolase family 18 protein [Oceanobacillus halotolerans]